MAIDPICKMEVDEKTAEFKSEYKGNTYYFCAAGCKKTFDQEPEKYIKDEKSMDMSHKSTDMSHHESMKKETSENKKKPWWKFW